MNTDPGASEMRESLRQFAKAMRYETPHDADFDIEEAIYWFASDYHGGQASMLYLALCRSPFHPGMAQNSCSSEASYAMYEHLQSEFATPAN